MAITYTFKFTDTLKTGFTVSPYTTDGNLSPTDQTLLSTSVAANTPLVMYGKSMPDYGEGVLQNMVYMLENFAGSIQPEPAVEGQIWYQISGSPPIAQLSIYNNTDWSTKVLLNNNVPPLLNDLDLSGNRIINLANAIDDTDALNRQTGDTRYIEVLGDTMVGDLVLTNIPTNPSHAINIQYADNNYINNTTDTMSGALILRPNIGVGSPVNPLEAASIEYVDTKQAAADSYLTSVTFQPFSGAASPTIEDEIVFNVSGQSPIAIGGINFKGQDKPASEITNAATGTTPLPPGNVQNTLNLIDSVKLNADGSQPMTGSLDFANAYTTINMQSPSDPNDGATKQYVDDHANGFGTKHKALDITFDNAGTNIANFDVQNALAEIDTEISIREPAVTGTTVNGKLSLSGSPPSTTAIDIAAGSGVFVDVWTNPDNITNELYSWDAITNFTIDMPDNIGVQTIYIDNTAVGSPFLRTILQQPGKFTNSEKRSFTELGKVYYNDGFITSVDNTPKFINNINYSFSDYMSFLSFDQKTDGLLVEPHNTALSVWVASGTLFEIGINWFNDATEPNIVKIPDDGSPLLPVTFDVVLSDGTISSANQTVIPKFYESGSPPSTIALAGTEAVIHYFYQLRGGKYILQVGDTVYTDAAAAQAALTTNITSYTRFPNSDVTFLSSQIYLGFDAVTFDDALAGIKNLAIEGSVSNNAGGAGSDGVAWGLITGTLGNQTDLQAELDLKTNNTGFNTHTADTTIHYVQGGIDHNSIQNIGTNTHIQIDNHITGTDLQHPATDISYDDTNTDLQGPGAVVDDVQLAIEKLDLKRRFKNTTNTGVIAGGLITEATTTTIAITDGNGAILDPVATPGSATGVEVTWSGLTSTVLTQDVSGFGSTYIFITSTGVVAQFSTRPSAQTFINNIYLGVVFYEASVITTIFNSPDVIDSTSINFQDFVDFTYPNVKGLTPIAIGAGDPNSDLEFYITDGDVFATGINWHTDIYNPNIIALPSNGTDTTGAIPWGGGAVFDYILSDGTVFATAQTLLQSDVYDDGTSTPGTPGGNNGIIHFIIKIPGGKTYVQPFTETYRDWITANSSVQNALSNLVLADEIREGITIGAYIGENRGIGGADWERGDRQSLTAFGSGGGSASGGGGGGVAAWGTITGTLSAQTDLQAELDLKESANANIQTHIADTTIHGYQPLNINAQVADYTLALSDGGNMVGMNLAGVNTVTVPTNATIAFPIGTEIIISQRGAGQTTIAGAGISFESAGGLLSLSAQFSQCTLIKLANNTWAVNGDMV